MIRGAIGPGDRAVDADDEGLDAAAVVGNADDLAGLRGGRDALRGAFACSVTWCATTSG